MQAINTQVREVTNDIRKARSSAGGAGMTPEMERIYHHIIRTFRYMLDGTEAERAEYIAALSALARIEAQEAVE